MFNNPRFPENQKAQESDQVYTIYQADYYWKWRRRDKIKPKQKPTRTRAGETKQIANNMHARLASNLDKQARPSAKKNRAKAKLNRKK